MNARDDPNASLALLLASVPLFAGLDAKTLARLARSAERLDVGAGTVLFSRGERPRGLYGVVAGRVMLSIPASREGEKVVSLVGPGQSFAEPAAFLDAPHLTSAQTLTPATLVHVRKEALPECMRADPQFAAHVVRSLSRRVRELVAEVENASVLSGTQRVVDFLLHELRDGDTAHPATIKLPAKKRIIASRLDLTQEHFSRILHELVAAGLILVQASTLTIPDVAALRAYGESSREMRQARDGRRTRARAGLM